MSTPVIQVANLVVEYGRGTKKARAVDGISFEVRQGQCVGFIGANGAGKSTTIKTLMGFIFPASGSVRVFGLPPGDVEARRRLGYLPEVTLYYPFMKARELLELYGGLHGLTRAQLRERIPPLLDEVGLGGRAESLLREFSKGMQQRLGIAQAIIARPEALVFDELSSGLDPVGRHDLREVLLRLKREGTTIFFSSHELTEVEALCDRVVMINRGRLVADATVEELVRPLNRFELEFTLPGGGAPPAGLGACEKRGAGYAATISGTPEYNAALRSIADAGGTVTRTESRMRSLEDYFIGLVGAGKGGG